VCKRGGFDDYEIIIDTSGKDLDLLVGADSGALRRRQSLQHVRLPLLTKLLKHLLVVTSHLTGVALNTRNTSQQ